MDGIQLITGVNDIKYSVRTILMTPFDVHDKLFQEYSKKQIVNGFATNSNQSLPFGNRIVHIQIAYHSLPWKLFVSAILSR